MTEDPASEQDNGKPKATRNILLIRHSQYNLSGNSDKERILTPLGPRLSSVQSPLMLGIRFIYVPFPSFDSADIQSVCFVFTSRSRAGRADGEAFGSVGTQVRHPHPLQHDQGHGNGKHHQ